MYHGQKVRLFVDEHSDAPAFFFNEAGTLDLAVIRDHAGTMKGIEEQSFESHWFDEAGTAQRYYALADDYEQALIGEVNEKYAE